MRENAPIPWIVNDTELETLVKAEGSGVILNDPSAQKSALNLGKTLRWGLQGKTRSFNALVGFFGHNQFQNIIGDDPAAIIVEEGREGTVSMDVEEGVGFRLLFGCTASDTASLALRAWYWLARYRKLYPEETTRKRAEMMQDMRERSFDAVCESLLGPSNPLVGFLFQEMPPTFASPNAWQASRAFLLDVNERTRKAAGILLGFWIQRQADIRAYLPSKDVLFHPKIYVVERESASIAIVGSANWSTRAFGGYDGANVEIGTVHACSGNAWADEHTGTLASKVAATARILFDKGNAQLGSWTDPEALLVDAELAMDITKHDPSSTNHEPEFTRKTQDPEKLTPEPTSTFFAPILKQIIEQTLGIHYLDKFEVFERLFRDGIFAERRPQRYQLDGATRLINILRSSRGAFLTDEPGLGKTLISQMVATYHLANLLEERLRGGSKEPVRYTIVAPARVIGDESGKDSVVKTVSGWFGFAHEIKDAVAAVLPHISDTPVDHGYVGTALELLEYRVLSTASFSRKIVEDDTLRKHVVDDFLHVALSEFIILDESHNFRNPSSRATRTLRFLTSLPVPGEDWPIERRKDEFFRGDGSRKRKVLCLSATPFNNRLEDITTQVGHFGRIQSWDSALQSQFRESAIQARIEETLLPIEVALESWPNAPIPTRRECFEVLIKHAIPHFQSGRQLEAGDDRVQQTEARDKVYIQNSSDGGPTYSWHSEDAQSLQMSFAPALQWAKQVRAGERSLDDEESDIARRRLDALLSKLVVQRSRARVLKIAQALDGEPIEEMFRSPQIPRHPLPLNQPSENTKFEADVLGKLQQLMVRAVSMVEDDFDEDILSLFSYRLGVRRGKQGKAGGKDQAESNQIGFQIANLTKRLQSSPYAFLRTILRGPFRRAIFELAVLEQLTKARPELTQSLHVNDELSYLTQKLTEIHLKESIATLLGGSWPKDGERTLCGLIGADERGDNSLLKKQLDECVEKAIAAMEKGTLDDEHWLSALVADVKKTDSSLLWKDIKIVLDWANKELSESIYRGLEDSKFVGQPLPFKGQTMLTIRKSIEAAVKSDASQEVKGGVAKMLGDWAKHRLDADRRLLGLISWLTLQNAARIEHVNLPAGYKTLVFSEYTDTQDYIATVLCTLDFVFRFGSPTTDLYAILWRGIDATIHVLIAGVDEVHGGEPTLFSQPHLFKNPLDVAWVTEWSLARGSDALKRALLEMTVTLGHVSSKNMGMLADTQQLPQTSRENEEPETEEEETEEASLESVGEAPILDAFSPWYQIAPNSSDRDEDLHAGFRERLSRAAQRPVYTLLATEVLSEGVNLQECGVVAHYDLPWNPTRLIQRNGRVDRRIFQTYEQSGHRQALAARLGLNPAQTPPFSKPHQVYHLTVVPVEPVHDEGRSDIVRRVLFAKLEAIRALFGLSSWPVVLSSADAKTVLHGELDFETPGFRRREELFAAWRELKHTEKPNHDRGSLVIEVGASFLRDVFKRLSGTHQGKDTQRFAQTNWSKVRGLQVVAWTPFLQQSLPMHSEADYYRNLSKVAGDPRFGAIAGSLFQRNEDSELEFITWFEDQQESRKCLTPGLISKNRFQAIDLETLGITGAPSKNTALPGAPTAFAEEILLSAVEIILKDQASQLTWLKNQHIPAEEAQIFNALEAGRAPGHFERYLNEITDRIDGSKPEKAEKSKHPAANLWIRIKEDTLQ